MFFTSKENLSNPGKLDVPSGKRFLGEFPFTARNYRYFGRIMFLESNCNTNIKLKFYKLLIKTLLVDYENCDTRMITFDLSMISLN